MERPESTFVRSARQHDLGRVSAGEALLICVGFAVILAVLIGGLIVTVDRVQGNDNELTRAVVAFVNELRIPGDRK